MVIRYVIASGGGETPFSLEHCKFPGRTQQRSPARLKALLVRGEVPTAVLVEPAQILEQRRHIVHFYVP